MLRSQINCLSCLFHDHWIAFEAVLQMLFSSVESEFHTCIVFLPLEARLKVTVKKVSIGLMFLLHLNGNLKLKGSHLCVLKVTGVEGGGRRFLVVVRIALPFVLHEGQLTLWWRTAARANYDQTRWMYVAVDGPFTRECEWEWIRS